MASSDPPFLDERLLADLNQRWRDQGGFVADALLPGLTE
jgi:hypothetical protein